MLTERCIGTCTLAPLIVMDNKIIGNILNENIHLSDYKKYIGEAVEKDSFLKFPYYKPLGYKNGMYRVGALSRLNISNFFSTSLADK